MNSNTVFYLLFAYLFHIVASLDRIFSDRQTADYQHDTVPKQIVYNNKQILLFAENGTHVMDDIYQEPRKINNASNAKTIKNFQDDKGNEVNVYGFAAFLHVKGKSYHKILTEESFSIYKMDYDSKKKLIYTLSGPPGNEKEGGFMYFFDMQNASICNEKVVSYPLTMDNSESKILTFSVDKTTGDLVIYTKDNKLTLAKDNSIYTPFASANCRSNQPKNCDFSSSSDMVDKIVNLHDGDLNVTATKLRNDYKLLRVQFHTLMKRYNALVNKVGQAQNVTLPAEPNQNFNSSNFKGTLQVLLQEAQTSITAGRSKCEALEQSVKALENKLDLTRSRLLITTQSRFSVDVEDEETNGVLKGLVSPRRAADSDDTKNTYVCMDKSVLKDFKKSISTLISYKNNSK